MNMNKALQNLYHAVSGSTTTKVNISKLLVDIRYAITGVESSVKNNWSRIIDSMATNWPEGGGGGGGSSDFSVAEVTLNLTPPEGVTFAQELVAAIIGYPHSDNLGNGYHSDAIYATNHKVPILLYDGVGYIAYVEGRDLECSYDVESAEAETSGDVVWDETVGAFGAFVVTGNGTITASVYQD